MDIRLASGALIVLVALTAESAQAADVSVSAPRQSTAASGAAARAAVETGQPAAASRKGSLRQSYLRRLAERLPGRSCDPDGPVYVVIQSNPHSTEAFRSDRIELLIHFTHGGAPDEIRVARSTGDPDMDARLADAVCARVRVGSLTATALSDGGWAPLTVRLGDPARGSSLR